MKIQAVNNTIYNKANTNFKGLWGKMSVTPPDFDRVMNIPKIEYSYYYYPFAKETPEEIKKNQEMVQKAVIDESEDMPKYLIHDFKLCTTLPFDKKKYEEYKNVSAVNRLSENNLQYFFKMHNYIKDKYLTSGYEEKQVSAANEKLASKFLELNM